MYYDYRKFETYTKLIQAILTSESDNLKHAPEGKSVPEKIASLANLLSSEIIKQLNESVKPLDSFKNHEEWSDYETNRYESTMAFVLGNLSRASQDSLNLTQTPKQWVEFAISHGQNFCELYKK